MIRGRCPSLAIDPESGQFSAHDIGECTLGIRQLARGVIGIGGSRRRWSVRLSHHGLAPKKCRKAIATSRTTQCEIAAQSECVTAEQGRR